LENVLAQFNGTILFVSHDRYFIDALADTIWMVENGTVTRFDGNYSDYAVHLTQRDVERAKAIEPRADRGDDPSRKQNGQATTSVSGRDHRDHERQQREQKKQLAALERQIAQLEQQLITTQAAIEKATAASKIDQIAQLGNEYVALEQRLLDEYERWAELAG
jgi:ATP-binding cassette subfamily F protein 3